MARKKLMTWEGPKARWRKMKDGKVYTVTTDTLGTRATEEESWRQANQWWILKQAELLQAPPPPVLDGPSEKLAGLLGRVSREQLVELACKGMSAERLLQAMHTSSAEYANQTEAPYGKVVPFEQLLSTGVSLPGLSAFLSPDDTPLTEAETTNKVTDLVEAVAGEAVPLERTIGALARKWVADRQHEARSGVIGPDHAVSLRQAILHFVAFAGETAPVESIDYASWHKWYVHCAGEVAKRDEDDKAGWSAGYTGKVFSASRTFVRWLGDTDILEKLPKNLTDKKHKFCRPDNAIVTHTNEEIHALLNGSKGQGKLHLLLMLNTGATQRDISDLRKEQIDLTAGTITRRRSKTARQRNTPLVCYPLWPCTLALLREHMSADPVTALLTQKGNPWVTTSLRDDGMLGRADNIAVNFRKVQLAVGIRKPLKIFRKTSATRLKSEPRYRDLRHYFLGHSEKNMADKHYAAESGALLTEAVQWLGRQYGLVG